MSFSRLTLSCRQLWQLQHAAGDKIQRGFGSDGYPAYYSAFYMQQLEIRKLTKTKDGFSNEHSLLKLLYRGLLNAQEKWTMPIQSWNLTLSQLAIYFEGRLNNMMML